MAELQYYDGKFVGNETNMVYHNLVNCIPIKPPYFNTSFRTLFTQAGREKGDKSQFFVTKRAGFQRVKTYTWNSGETSLVEDNIDDWFFTDMKVLKGYRYFFAVYKDRSRMRVYKQINTNDLSPCSNSCYNDIEDGNIVNITKYTFKNGDGSIVTQDYFPFSSCLYDKFVFSTHVYGKPIDEGTDGTAFIQRLGDTYFSGILRKDRTPIKGNGGNYVYITGGGNGIQGYVMPIGGKASELPAGQLGVDTNALFLNGTRIPGIDMAGPDGTPRDVQYLYDNHFKVFPEYTTTIHRATSDGIMSMSYSEDKPSAFVYSPVGDTYYPTYNNALESRYVVSSMCTYGNHTAFINNKTGIVYISGIGFNKFSYPLSNSIVSHGLYTSCVEYMGVLLLLGPDNIGYIIYDDTTGNSLLQDANDQSGYFSKNSFTTVDERFFIVRKTQDYYLMEMQTGYGSAKPIISFTYMNAFLNTDLDMLIKGLDEVGLCTNDNYTYMFLTNGNNDTKVLLFDRYYNLRYKRYVKGCQINSIVDGVFLGKGVFKNTGETDNGSDITQIVTMTFGDQGHSTTKRLEYVKLPIGYNSRITKENTAFIATSIHGGRLREAIHSDLGKTDYVDNMMKLRVSSGKVNNILEVVKTYPTDIIISGARGVNFEQDISTLYGEIEEYKNYKPSLVENTFEGGTFTVGKYGVLKFSLGMRGELFNLEIIAKGKDKIEFGGFFIGFQNTDIDSIRIENNYTSQGLTVDSGKTFKKLTSSDEILGVTP